MTRSVFRQFLALGFALLLNACNPVAEKTTVPTNPQRIISLTPSTTEILCAIGAEERLDVARQENRGRGRELVVGGVPDQPVGHPREEVEIKGLVAAEGF